MASLIIQISHISSVLLISIQDTIRVTHVDISCISTSVNVDYIDNKGFHAWMVETDS